MKSATGTTPDMDISVGLSTSLQSQLGGEGCLLLQREVDRHGADMAADLGLPTPRVQILEIEDSPWPFEVTINGSPCRIPLRHHDAPHISTPLQLASSISRVIHLNRELLVDERIADGFRASFDTAEGGGCLPGLSRDSFLRYLRMLVRGCFRIDRGGANNDSMGISFRSSSANACYEETVRPLSALFCALLIPPGRSVTDEVDDQTMEELLELMQEGLFYELGIRFPRMETIEDHTLEDGEFRVRINDLRLPRGRGMKEGEFLVNSPPEGLKSLGIEGRAATNPATGGEGTIVRGGRGVAAEVRKAGLSTWGRGGYMVLACSGELRRHAPAFITVESVEYDLDTLRFWYPDLIRSAIDRFGVPMIVQVLRSLAEESIPVRHLTGVLEAMLSVGSTVDVDFARYIVFRPYVTSLCPATFGREIQDVDATGYAECVRSRFREFISSKYSVRGDTLEVHLLDRTLESRIAASERDPLTPMERLELLEAIHSEMGKSEVRDRTPIILTTTETRKPLRRLIEVEFAEISVLSYEELSPYLNIEVIGRISLP